MEKYNGIIQKAYSVYAEEKGSTRMKMMEKEAKKLIKDDFKQRKKEKNAETSEKHKDTNSEPAVMECSSPHPASKHNFTSEHYIPHPK